MAVCCMFDGEFSALSPEQIAELNDQAQKMQNAKINVLKQVKCAQQCDVTKVARSFQEAVSAKLTLLHCGTDVFKLNALHSRTGYYGICILVCGDHSMAPEPVVAKTGRIAQFFEEVAKKPFIELLGDLDVWCNSGLKGKFYFTLLIICSPHLLFAGFTQKKKDIQECKKYCQNQLKAELRQ